MTDLILTPQPESGPVAPARIPHQARRRYYQAAGLHPTGAPLGPAGRTCGECAHHWVRRYDKAYHKCELVGDTAGPATDIRVRWPACARWEEAK
jgi:hypothetical protein